MAVAVAVIADLCSSTEYHSLSICHEAYDSFPRTKPKGQRKASPFSADCIRDADNTPPPSRLMQRSSPLEVANIDYGGFSVLNLRARDIYHESNASSSRGPNNMRKINVTCTGVPYCAFCIFCSACCVPVCCLLSAVRLRSLQVWVTTGYTSMSLRLQRLRRADVLLALESHLSRHNTLDNIAS